MIGLARRGFRKALTLWRVRIMPLMRGHPLTPAEYWSHQTVAVLDVATPDESLAYFHWRNDQYRGYIDLMSVAGHDGEVVLDYGCGPGHDLVGIGHYSSPARLMGCDVSPKALWMARKRLDLHDTTVDLVQIGETDDRLPFDDGSIDYIHSSGVLHHVPDPVAVLREFGRILKPDGYSRVMVYNYDSVWLHLYVAYQMQLVERKYADLNIRDAFSKTTDGQFCPIAEVWTPPEGH
jgi:SAM-dependent methyltransferase